MASSRTEAESRYRELPLPTTKDEHWRFTDLAGFDPDAWSANGAAQVAAPPSMLDLDVAGVAHVGEAGIEIERAPEGIRFEPLTDDHELLYSLVGFDEKFAAHNAALWKHGLLVHVPKGVVVEKPLYVRVANSVEEGSLFWRLLIVAEPESRFALIEEYASSTPELARVLERRGRDRRPAGREGRVRLRPEPLARDVALRVAPRARRARRRARLGRGRLRLREGQGAHPERPRGAWARPRA